MYKWIHTLHVYIFLCAQLLTVQTSISPSPDRISPGCHFLSCLCTLSLNCIYSCMSWLIYSMNILIKCCCRDQFLYGVMNLYSWPWMWIWRCVIIEESCPTKEVYRGNYVCYVCISWNEPVWHTQTDTLTQMKNEENRNMQDLCVTRGGFWSSGLKCDASRRDVFQWWLDVEGGGRTKRVEAFWDPKVIIYAPKDFTILWMNYVRAICSRRGMIKVQLEERRRVKNKWDIMIALFIIAG